MKNLFDNIYHLIIFDIELNTLLCMNYLYYCEYLVKKLIDNIHFIFNIFIYVVDASHSSPFCRYVF